MKENHQSKCPVTGLPFFMEIDGKPTYGGPYDSYTIPEWDEEDESWYRERYDHDLGGWIDGVEYIELPPPSQKGE